MTSLAPTNNNFKQQVQVEAVVLPDNPRVSVIIPTYNHAHYVIKAIHSVLQQTYDNYEILVIDDGSQDDTCDVVAQFEDQVRYIWQENRGLSGARNTGIRAAKGEMVALLDSDDLYEPDFLSTLVSILDENPGVDAVYCTAQTIDMDNNLQPERIGKVVPPDQFYETLLKGGFFPPICMFAYKYCYEPEGHLFDESLRRVEDLDLWLKFAKRYTIIGTDKILTRYRVTPHGLSSNPTLVLDHRIAVLQRHFRNGAAAEPQWTALQQQAFGRSYLATAYEYLQLGNVEQAYQLMCQAFDTSPDLISELEVFYELALGNQQKGRRGDFSTLNFEHNADVLIKLLDQVFHDFWISAKLRAYRPEAYANAYLALGLLSYGGRQFSQARRYLLRVVITNPKYALKRQVIITLIKSLLPIKLVDWLKQKRRQTTG